MSINSAMLAGVSGLAANSSALAAISDNIANVNTVAYKRNEVDFSTLVADQAVQGEYSAGGVIGVNQHYVSTQGQIQTSSSTTDMAISGDGFFVVSSSPTASAGASGATGSATNVEFTRDGTFAPNADGYLVNDAGMYLMGWPASSTGTFSPDPSDLGKLVPINVKDLGAAVKATNNVGVSANLNATTTISPAETATPPTYAATAGNSMADYASDPTTGTKPDFTMDMTVTDSQGGSHTVEMAFLKSGPNTWQAEAYSVPASDVDSGTGNPPGLIASGQISFNSDGSIVTTSPGTTFPTTLNLDASGGTTTPAWATSLGISSQSVNLDLSNLTQDATTSTVTSISNDGAGVGNIVGVQVDDQGVVSAVYDNSQVRKIAQVAVATFPDPNALTAVNGNAYQSTTQAGPMVLKQAGVGGAGQISPSSLEASTVDLSTEFTGLITTQKAYSASSKIITTADEMLDELINIIR